MGSDDADFAAAQTACSPGERDGAAEIVAQGRIIGVAVNQLEGMLGLTQGGCPQMLAHKRAGTHFAVAGTFGRGPENHGVSPVLRHGEGHLAVAHGGLEHDQRFAASLLDAIEGGADCRVVYDRGLAAYAVQSKIAKSGEAAIADDAVPLLIEARAFASED